MYFLSNICIIIILCVALVPPPDTPRTPRRHRSASCCFSTREWDVRMERISSLMPPHVPMDDVLEDESSTAKCL